MKYHVKSNLFFEARIYIGSRINYNGPPFAYEELREVVGKYQHEWGVDIANPVRITATNYVWDDYEEGGWEIAVINYPRRQKSHTLLRNFAFNLAGHLLTHFSQNRISVVFPDEIVMLEADDAEDQHQPREKRATTHQR